MDANTFRVKLAIPDRMPLNRVGLRQTPLKNQYGVSLEVENKERCAVLRGNEASVNSAVEQLQRLFSQCGAASSAHEVGSRLSETRLSGSTDRSLAVLSLGDTHWKFVKTADGVNDVNVDEYPFELVRATDDTTCATIVGRQNYRAPSVMNFDDTYMARTVRSLNISSNPPKLKAVFGRKLFSHRMVDPGAVYSVDGLTDVMNASRGSVWSNVCDADSPVPKELLSLLQTKAAKDEGTQPKVGMSVRLVKADGNRNVKLKFAREDGKWVYISSVFPGDTRCKRDIMIADRLTFRVRASAESQPKLSAATEASAPHGVTVCESADGNMFTALVTVPPGDYARVKWVSVKSAVLVPHEGLEFKIIRRSQESNRGLLLEAKLPEPVAGSSGVGALGDRFELLATKLQSILCEIASRQAE